MSDYLVKTADRIAMAVETARKRGWGDTCLTCLFFAHRDSHADAPAEPEAHHGQCRRYPPTPGVWFEENSYGWSVDYGSPVVDGTDWCGEHQPVRAALGEDT